jgi:asparagine synthase (glutamine-hydrolysing)
MEQGAKGEAESAVRAMRDPDTVMAMTQRVRQGTTQVYQDGTEYLAPQCIDESVIVDETMPVYPEPYSSRLSNALFRVLTCTKLPRVLRMNDRLAMAHGVELRQPFLDYRLVEFAFRLPPSLKMARGYGKYILRRAMESRLPRDIAWTHKRPVVTPQREWMVGPLRPWVEDIINSRAFAERGLFNVDQVRRTFRNYLDGRMNNAFPVWQWINTELWHRAFVDCQQS